MNNCLIYPELVLLIAAGICLLRAKKHYAASAMLNPRVIGTAALLIAGLMSILLKCPEASGAMPFAVDTLTTYGRGLMLVCAVLVLINAASYGRFFSFFILIVVSLSMIMAGSTDFIALYVSLEIATMGLICLLAYTAGKGYTGFTHLRLFVIHLCSSAIIVFGISLLYASTGTTGFDCVGKIVRHDAGVLLIPGYIGLACMTVAMFFKIGLVPFHAWVFTVWEKLPPLITGFAVTVPFTGLMIALLRIFLLHHDQIIVTVLFSIVAVLTMSVANLTGLFQKDIQRLCMCACIAQSGYMLVGLAAGVPRGIEAALFILTAYAVTCIGICALLETCGTTAGHCQISSSDNMLFVSCFAILVFSLMGIPLTAGFTGMFSLVTAAYVSREYMLALVVVINMIISASYLSRIIHVFIFVRSGENRALSLPLFTGFTAGVCAVFTIVIGVFPQLVFTMIRNVSALFH